jgi:phage terminase large subunit-like protein
VFDDDETGAPQVPIVATTVGQAVRSCYGVAASMVRTNPELINRALIYTGTASARIMPHRNAGELFPIANDVDGLQGLDPSLAIFDEIGFQSIESWDSLTLASGKRERSVAIGVGTPGLDRENALFYLRNLVHEAGELPGVVFTEYSAPPGYAIDDREGWQIANPALKAGFLRESALVRNLQAMPEGHFRVFRLGQWVDGTDSWLGASGRALWDALYDPQEPLLEAPTFVGVDVGIKRDSTAVVFVQRRPDGHFHAWCRLWIPTGDQPVDVTDVMGHLRDLATKYRVEGISFDPRFFDVPAKMLSDEGLAMKEVPQSVEGMTRICGALLEVIKRQELRHSGDEAFTTHVLNAVPRLNERGFTLQKSKSRGRIDAVIALSLAIDQALHPEPAVQVLAAWD